MIKVWNNAPWMTEAAADDLAEEVVCLGAGVCRARAKQADDKMGMNENNDRAMKNSVEKNNRKREGVLIIPLPAQFHNEHQVTNIKWLKIISVLPTKCIHQALLNLQALRIHIF